MIRKNNTRGIAMISLVLTIIILVMLAGMVSYAGYDIINESKKTAFAKDLETLYDATQEYYMVNGSIPILESESGFSTDEYIGRITTLNGAEAAENLQSEILKNEDQTATFYEVSIQKIGIEDITYGVKKNENDYFIISDNSYKIYYYPGETINGNWYFSDTIILEK